MPGQHHFTLQHRPNFTGSTSMPHVAGFIRATREEQEWAEELAIARLTEPERKLSETRSTANKLPAQRRGAVGMIVLTRVLREDGFEPAHNPHDNDRAGQSDLVIDGVRFKVLTGQRVHREQQGFCVPEDKLATHRQGGITGYLFVGTDSEDSCEGIYLEGGATIETVQGGEQRDTWGTENRCIAAVQLLPIPEFVARYCSRRP